MAEESLTSSSPQIALPEAGSISCTAIRIRLSACVTEPASNSCTPRSPATWLAGLSLLRKGDTDAYDGTRNERTRARFEISTSVRPSAT